MHRGRALALAVVALAIAPTPAAAATARPVAAGPDPARMALTRNDVGYVASVEQEGYATKGPIAATRGYRRAFSGLSPGTVQYLTVQNTVLIGKDPSAAAKLIGSIVSAGSSPAGRSALYRQHAGALAASLGVPTAGGSVVRAKAIKVGDGGAEIVFRFVASEGDFQGGEVLVRVGGNLSIVTYGTVAPGVPEGFARLFALNAAARLKKG